MSLLPSIHDPDESFNPGMKWAAIVGTVVLIPLIVFFQFFLGTLSGATLATPLQRIAASEVASDPGITDLALTSKSTLMSLYFAADEYDRDETGAPLGRHAELADVAAWIKDLEKMALTRVDRLRVAIVVGELQGPEPALDRVQAVAREAEPGGMLAGEAQALEAFYGALAMGQTPVIQPDIAESLARRHGWFGRLAIAYPVPPGDPRRDAVLGGYGRLARFDVAQGLVGALAFLTGLGALAILFVRVRSGVTQFRITETGVPRIIMLETFAVFLACFFLVLVAGVLFLGSTSLTGVVLSELLMWSCALAVVWPLARAVSWPDLCEDLGLTFGEGLHKEVFAGVLGYLAGLPLILIVGIIAGLIENAVVGPRVGPEGVPMFESPLAGSWTGLVIGAIGACLWAPLVEEFLFRGALHNYLPAWMGVLGRCLLVGAIFGLVHPYSPAGLVQVASMGIVLGFLREWRGSLIAPVVAHFIHNAFITITSIVVVSMLA